MFSAALREQQSSPGRLLDRVKNPIQLFIICIPSNSAGALLLDFTIILGCPINLGMLYCIKIHYKGLQIAFHFSIL